MDEPLTYETSYLRPLPPRHRTPTREGYNPCAKYDQVEGSKPRVIREIQAPPREEINGCRPRSLIRNNVTRPVLNMTVSDIPGATSGSEQHKSKRSVDPLQPKYALPSYVVVQPVTCCSNRPLKLKDPPKFVRDAIDVSDILGTATKPPRNVDVRPSNFISDLPGASPTKLHK